jgi:hypothetical protein
MKCGSVATPVLAVRCPAPSGGRRYTYCFGRPFKYAVRCQLAQLKSLMSCSQGCRYRLVRALRPKRFSTIHSLELPMAPANGALQCLPRFHSSPEWLARTCLPSGILDTSYAPSSYHEATFAFKAAPTQHHRCNSCGLRLHR